MKVYHFTKSFDTLRNHILKDGFWPQYSLEDFSWIQDGKPLYLAFPCVCFTELPLKESHMHRDDYGNYLSDERELRYIPANHKDALFTVVDYDTRTMTELGVFNNATHDSHLIFDFANFSDVAIVIVTTNEEHQQLAFQFSKLADKITTWDELKARAQLAALHIGVNALLRILSVPLRFKILRVN